MKAALERVKSLPAPPIKLSGPEVSVIINSIDTGERKQIGSYTARQIKTTRTVIPGPGASASSSVDLPGLNCQDQFVETQLSAATRDRFKHQQLGNGRRGYALEETTRKTQNGNDEYGGIQLPEFTESPPDNSLFELPAEYSPALRTLQGNYDMTKPDTLRNRVQQYWTELLSAVHRIFK